MSVPAESPYICGMSYYGVSERHMDDMRKLVNCHRDTFYKHVEIEKGKEVISFRRREYSLEELLEGVLEYDIGSIYLFGLWLYGPDREAESRVIGGSIIKVTRDTGLMAASIGYSRLLLGARKSEEAVSELEGLTKRDYLPALYELGVLYFHGNYIKKDLSKAQAYFTEAKRRGHVFSYKALIGLQRKKGPLAAVLKTLEFWIIGFPYGMFLLITDCFGDRFARE